MALSYWGWEGDQSVTAAILKPNRRDKNVMPYEIADFVTEETELNALVRVGGDIDLIKDFIAAGFPVMIEKGLDSRKSGWIGHYQVLAGYDEAKGIFNAYDSYEGDFTDGQTLLEPFEKVESYWRHFNHIFIIIYPDEREAQVMSLLGIHQDETNNFLYAAEKASNDIFNLTGRDLFFAWYNRGTNLMQLRDYAGAAAAYDEAFNLYAALEPDDRPWRVFWYQTGPYFAYYFTARYHDVINLATQTIDKSEEPAIEESYYWRALAKEALGDLAGAIEDLKISLEWHPGFEPSEFQLDRLGVEY
jgi:tetratricopeptide (TPR) repeat protein